MPFADKARKEESKVKQNFKRYAKERYPKAHVELIPSTHFALLPYDMFMFYDAVFRAIELKVDDYEVQPHQYRALYEVVQNRGFAFVVRYINLSRSFIVENLTNSETRTFHSDPSDRQVSGESKNLTADDQPWSAKSAYYKTIDYIMSFAVSPIEVEIQRVIQDNYNKKVKEALDKKTGKVK